MNTRIHRLLLLMIGLAFAGLAPLAAQDDAAATEEASAGDDTNIFDLIIGGGITMIPLGLLSMAATGLTVYNFMVVREKNFLSVKEIEELEPMIDQLDIEGAKALCNESNGPAVNIIGAGLNRIVDGEMDQAAIDRAVEEASEEETVGKEDNNEDLRNTFLKS